MFDDIDKDRSGYITPDEVQAMFKSLGVEISVAEAKSIVDEADTDKDGKMSYEGTQCQHQYIYITRCS